MDKREFIKHVRNWEARMVKKALKDNPELSTQIDRSGKSPLHHCAGVNPKKAKQEVRDSIETAKALLASGAEVNAVRIIMDEGEEFRATPLWYAAAWGENFDLVSFLLKNGSDPNQCMWAAAWNNDLKLAKLLLSYGADIDPVFHHETPLLQIIKAKRLGMLDWLVKNGADINFQDDKGYTALHHAIRKGYSLAEVKELLNRGANPNLKAKDGNTSISLAAHHKKTKLKELLASYV